MRLADPDLQAIPGPAAWYDSTGALVATTPEWRGRTAGTVAYRAGELTLFSVPAAYDAQVAAICARLVDRLGQAAQQATSGQRIRLEVLIAGLRLVLGQQAPDPGTTDDAVLALQAALELSNPPLGLDCHPAVRLPCPSPRLVALALKQLATNAQRHGGATGLALAIVEGPTFHLRWHGPPLAQAIRTSRHPSRRNRWGAGFARLAADALGAVIYDPRVGRDGLLTVSLAIQPSDLQLRLPLALVDPAGKVLRSTRTWDEETHALPGQPLIDAQAWRAMKRATATPGETAAIGAFAARTTSAGTWIAVLPSDTLSQATDLVAGLAHEHDLLRVAEPHRTEVLGLAAVLRCCLGQLPEPWDPCAVAGPYRTAATALGVDASTLVVPPGATHAPDPLLTAFLLSELHGSPRWDSILQRWILDRPRRDASPIIFDALTRDSELVFLA